jgi:hypothetical protein
MDVEAGYPKHMAISKPTQKGHDMAGGYHKIAIMIVKMMMMIMMMMIIMKYIYIMMIMMMRRRMRMRRKRRMINHELEWGARFSIKPNEPNTNGYGNQEWNYPSWSNNRNHQHVRY